MGNATDVARQYACEIVESDAPTDVDGCAVQPLPVDPVALECCSRAESRASFFADEVDFKGLHPAYEDGTLVEYFSPTHKIWIIGSVHLSIEKSKKWTSTPVFIYNVSLKKSGQVRTRVPLDMIRAPFSPTELVEVFSKRNSGQWMSATVRGPPAGGSIAKGYKVSVEEQAGVPEMLLENVPSWRIRRRFPPRSSIDAYRGPVLGWMKAVVHSVISAFPAEPPVPLSPFSPGTAADLQESTSSDQLPGAQPQPTADASTQWMRDDAATVCASTVCGEDMGVHPWVQVPVYVEEWDEEEWGRDPDIERAQWMPSYLIRMSMIQLASSKQYERRSFIM